MSPRSEMRATDGPAAGLAIGGLLIFAVCGLAVLVPTALGAAFGGGRTAGWLERKLLYSGVLAALAGGVACVSTAAAGVRQLRGGRPVWGAMLLLAGVAAGVALLALAAARSAATHLTDPHDAVRRWTGVWGIAWACAGGIWALRCWWAQARRIAAGDFGDAEARIGRCLRGAGGRELLVLWGCVWLSAGVVCLVSLLPPSWYILSKSATSELELAGLVFTSGCSIALLGLAQCVVLGGILAATAAAARRGRMSGRASLAIGLAAGALAVLFCLYGLGRAFGDEMGAAGLNVAVWALVPAAGLLYGAGVSGFVLELCRDPEHPRDPADLVRICILAGVLMPILADVRRARGRVRPSRGVYAAGWAVLAAAIAAVVPLLWPTMEDSLDRVQFLLVVWVVLLAVLLGHLLTPSTARLWKIRLCLFVLLAGTVLIGLYAPFGVWHLRGKVSRCDPIGRYSLRAVEGLVRREPRTERPKALRRRPPLELTGRPTRRRAVMDRLKEARPLTIVIIWDGCRQDRMSILGYRRRKPPFISTTPCLDRRKHEILRFRHTFTQGSSTTTSLRHLYTARYSSRWMEKKKGIAPFWTNDLIRAGYDTFHLNIIDCDVNGISTDAFLRDMPADLRSQTATLDCFSCGPDDKKDVHRHGNRKADPALVRALKGRIKFIECNMQSERTAVQHLLSFLRTRQDTGGRGIFAFIHMDITHSPWTRRAEVPDFGAEKLDMCDSVTCTCDLFTGELIDGLEELGMWGNTILAVTADHGEIRTGGGGYPWHDRIRVPLVVRIPGVAGRDVDPIAGLIDLGPTLVDVFAPEKLSRYEGRSLWPVIFGDRRWPRRILFGVHSWEDCYYLVRGDGLHYIHNRGYRYDRLFNWRKDPASDDDLIREDRPATTESRMYMDWFLNEHGKGRGYNDPYSDGPPPRGG